MSRIYFLFSVVGWAWAMIVFAAIFVTSRRKQPRGFDVVVTGDKQH